jgi:hypothetical protein
LPRHIPLSITSKTVKIKENIPAKMNIIPFPYDFQTHEVVEAKTYNDTNNI